jgi:sugar phosphate isomerase/epimerase
VLFRSYAAEKKVGLSVKPHGGLNATGAQCRKLIETVGHKNFRVWYDPGNIFYYSQGKLDPVDDVPSVDGLVAGVSVKDFVPPKEVAVTPGTGKVNFREVLARLKKGGFTAGPLIVECLARGDSAAKITAEAKKAREFLEEVAGRL